MGNKFKLIEKSKAVDRAVREMALIAAKDAIGHFQKSFDNEGFTDETLQTWKPRRNQIRGVGAAVKSRLPNTRKTLTKTGALKKSIRIGYVNGSKVILRSSLDYSAIHNEGLMGNAWGRHRFRMPKRKFMGNSRNLERRTAAKYLAKINTAIKNA